MSPESKNRFVIPEQRLADKKNNIVLRAGINQSIRRFFTDNGYIEVETPILIPAPAPEVHIDAIRAHHDAFLQTSPELCMKRLLAAGYPKIFQISRCFRAGERGDFHLPEFTLLEWYHAGIDYQDLMVECEALILFIAHELGLGKTFEYCGKFISLEKPWDRLTIQEAFKRFSSITLEDALTLDRFNEVMVEDIEPQLSLGKPTFIYDYPAALASLARTKETQPEFAERFELYMGGLELANGFSELTDADEQSQRFDEDLKIRKSMGKSTYPIPKKFLKDLVKMPPSAGIALGMDRLVMLFSNTTRIDDVVSFTPEEL